MKMDITEYFNAGGKSLNGKVQLEQAEAHHNNTERNNMDDEDKNQKEISRSTVNRQVREWENLATMLDDMGIASTAGLSLSERVNMAIKVERRRYSAAEFKTDSMRKAFAKITHELKHAAGNRKLMQVARPARTCINLAKPFLPENK